MPVSPSARCCPVKTDMDVYTWQEPNLWGVLDDTLRIRIGRTDEGYLWISVDIQMWSDPPTMGNFTHGDTNRYATGELTISEDGLLTAMHRHPPEHDFRSGFSLRVPLSFVSPLRAALERAGVSNS